MFLKPISFMSSQAPAVLTLTSISVGGLSNGELPLSIVSPDAQAGDLVKLVLVPQGSGEPSPEQVDAGENAAGGAPLDAFTATWPATSQTLTIATGIDQFCDLYGVLNNGGSLSNVESALNFEVDTTNPGLSAVTGTQTGSTTADWGATSDEAAQTIFAAVRLDSDPVLGKSDIENGTGNAVDADTDATPTADANNGGSFTGLTASTAYRVDSFQRDEFGNESAVASSAQFTTAAASGGEFPMSNAPSVPAPVLRFNAYNLVLDGSSEIDTMTNAGTAGSGNNADFESAADKFGVSLADAAFNGKDVIDATGKTQNAYALAASYSGARTIVVMCDYDAGAATFGANDAPISGGSLEIRGSVGTALLNGAAAGGDIYVDGAIFNTANAFLPLAAPVVIAATSAGGSELITHIGRDNNAVARVWAGKYAEVMVFDTVLSAAQILELSNALNAHY